MLSLCPASLSLPTTLFLLKPFLVMQAAMLEATIHGCPYGGNGEPPVANSCSEEFEASVQQPVQN